MEFSPDSPPDVVRLSTERSEVTFRRSDGLYAVHGTIAGDEPQSPVLILEGGLVRVHEGRSPESGEAGALVGPVYGADPDGAIAVPTGRIFVRFEEGSMAADRAGEIEAAGFAVDEVVSYAPHAAWVVPSSGSIADALANVEALEDVSGVVNVEPQLLREVGYREAGRAQRRFEPR